MKNWTSVYEIINSSDAEKNDNLSTLKCIAYIYLHLPVSTQLLHASLLYPPPKKQKKTGNH